MSNSLLFLSLMVFGVSQGQVTDQTDLDPCVAYNMIDDIWRLPDYQGSANNCDDDLQAGWYAFNVNKEAVMIPTQCIQEFSCGTRIPLHVELEGKSLPEMGESVDAWLCGSYDILGSLDCCVLRQPVTIRRCQGDFFVYNLTQQDRCPVAICVQKLSLGVPGHLVAKRGDTPKMAYSSTTPDTEEYPYPEVCAEGLQKCHDGRCVHTCPTNTTELSAPASTATPLPEITRTFGPIAPGAQSSPTFSEPSSTSLQAVSSSGVFDPANSSSDSENQTVITMLQGNPDLDKTSELSSSDSAQVPQQSTTDTFSTDTSDPGRTPWEPSENLNTTSHLTSTTTVLSSLLNSTSASSHPATTAAWSSKAVSDQHSQPADLPSVITATSILTSTSWIVPTSSPALPSVPADFESGVRLVVKGQFDEQTLHRYLEISMKVFLASREHRVLNVSANGQGSMDDFTNILERLRFESLELVYGFFQNVSLINGTLDSSIKVYSWVQMLDNNITLFDLVTRDHLFNETISSRLILAVLRRTNFTRLVNSLHAKMAVVAMCLVEEHCEQDFLHRADDKAMPIFQQHRTIFIIVIVIAAASLLVLLLAFLYIQCSKRGSWVLVQEKEVPHHTAVESPITDQQIMDGEDRTVTSLTVNGYPGDNPDHGDLEQVDLDQDNTWVVPLEQSVTAQDTSGKTEDTRF